MKENLIEIDNEELGDILVAMLDLILEDPKKEKLLEPITNPQANQKQIRVCNL